MIDDHRLCELRVGNTDEVVRAHPQTRGAPTDVNDVPLLT
jgi:hypothetical protein